MIIGFLLSGVDEFADEKTIWQRLKELWNKIKKKQ